MHWQSQCHTGGQTHEARVVISIPEFRVSNPRLAARWLTLLLLALLAARSHAQQQRGPLDPAAWGGDHVELPLPEFMSGDECLFCHREIGSTWGENRHQRTMRPLDSDGAARDVLLSWDPTGTLAREVELLLGGDRQLRFLKRTDRYGQLALLTAAWRPAEPAEAARSQPREWDEQLFAARCAGCHTSGVDSRTGGFLTTSLDCFTCHGDVTLDHTRQAGQLLLSPQRRSEPREIISICGQCHLRGGRSRSTGLPYPNKFVAGDNLFRDFQVDWSDEHLAALNPADRHVFENARDVALYGKTSVTCLSCHQVHRPSSEAHQSLEDQRICRNCHQRGEDKSAPRGYTVHSTICGY